MADVHIVCVREDEPQAKALAEMFEAAGFSIGGAPSSDGALRSSGAGLVVWSQASIRSRPFLDAAQRVINADKAVVASLIEPPPPSSIGDSPVFDLTRWDGDPNDPQLDPLFFAVDRMVNSARASVGASAAPAAEPAYEPPPPRRAAAPPPPPPAAPKPPTYTRPGADPLSSEAEHWRAIRDSRNPSDFMDHLARFGPEGAFAEVAELRLKQLTAAQEARTPAPPTRPTVAPPSTPRAPLAPRVAMPPTRSEPPPQRRYDPPPEARRPEPTRRPPPERYDREVRDPPRGEGGPLRALVLIALLGGAALAGGIYFGGGMNDLGGSATQQEDQQIAEAPAGEPESYSDDPAGPDAISLGEAIDPAPRRTEQPRREPTPPREETRQQQQQQQQRDEDRAAAPSTSWAGNTTQPGGPVSLQPGGASQPSSPTTSPGPVPLGPAAAPMNSDPAPAPSTTRTATPARAATVSFSSRPSARRIADLYPNRALRNGVGGRAVLDCTVGSSLSLNCSVASESPAGLGFGQAAMQASSSYRANPTRSDGSSAVGQSTRIVVQFQAPSE